MTDEFKAVLESDYYSYHSKYWRVEIKSNNLYDLVKIVNLIDRIRSDDDD